MPRQGTWHTARAKRLLNDKMVLSGSSCVAEDKFLYLPELQFPHPEEEGGKHPFSNVERKQQAGTDGEGHGRGWYRSSAPSG